MWWGEHPQGTCYFGYCGKHTMVGGFFSGDRTASHLLQLFPLILVQCSSLPDPSTHPFIQLIACMVSAKQVKVTAGEQKQ